VLSAREKKPRALTKSRGFKKCSPLSFALQNQRKEHIQARAFPVEQPTGLFDLARKLPQPSWM
jgi:hypothetical protein